MFHTSAHPANCKVIPIILLYYIADHLSQPKISYFFPILGASGSGNTAGPSSGSIGAIDFSNIRLPGQAQTQRAPVRRSQVDPYALRELLLASPREVALLKQNNPPLSEALESNDPGIYLI